MSARPYEVTLRDTIEADLPAFFEHQRNPDASRMAAFPARERHAFMAHWARLLADPSVVKKTVLVGDGLAGNIVCFPQTGQLLVGYWLGRDHWGRGIATRALAAFLRELPSRPLLARVAAHNLGSIRVLQKCGFVQCGADTVEVGPDGATIEELVFRLVGDPSCSI